MENTDSNGQNAPAVELFTHPTCSGCQDALTALRALERNGRVRLQVTSLGTASGRQRAEGLGVTSVPTVHVDGEFVVLMRNADLVALLARLEGAAS